MKNIIKNKSFLLAAAVLLQTTGAFGMEVEGSTSLSDHEQEVVMFLDAQQRAVAFQEIKQLFTECQSHVDFKTDWAFVDYIKDQEIKDQKLAQKVYKLTNLISQYLANGNMQPHEDELFKSIAKELNFYHTGSYLVEIPLELYKVSESEYHLVSYIL